METTLKANSSKTKEERLEELHIQQAKLKELQSELDVMESKISHDERLSREDIKFVGELGWLSAAAVTIATIASSL